MSKSAYLNAPEHYQAANNLPKLFIDGKCKGGLGCLMEAESNNDLFKWLDKAKIKYEPGQTKVSRGYDEPDFFRTEGEEKIDRIEFPKF